MKSILFSLAVFLVFPLCAQQAARMDYMPKDYAYLYGMPGFSEGLLKLHFQLYQGYVKNANYLLGRLRELELQDKEQSYEYGGLKRRLGWEWDGMRLHEFYFDNLGGHEPLDKSAALFQRIVKDYGSYDAWKKSFVATGLIRGIGWVILYRDPQSGRLINVWINEHDLGHLAGGTPLLVMDVFEHAYITQYGLDRAKYINAFFDNIEWAKVAKRYNDAVAKDTILN
jgi:Fe-Mn family superoxide dismutase